MMKVKRGPTINSFFIIFERPYDIEFQNQHKCEKEQNKELPRVGTFAFGNQLTELYRSGEMGENANYDPFDCGFDDFLTSSDASTAAAIETHVEEEAIVASGRAEGREAGLQEGFREGRLLGQTTGVEYGMEIGFAAGLLEAVRQAIAEGQLPEKSIERITKSANDLEKAIDDFPSSQESIRERLFQSKSIKNDDDENGDEQSQRHHDKEEDVRAKLQRIRARCKVLAAKLGIPHHSLKTIMADTSQNKAAAKASNSNNGIAESTGGDQDW